MLFRRGLRRGLMAAFVAVAAILSLAPGAQAKPVPVGTAPCELQLCFWDGQLFDTHFDHVAFTVNTNNCINLPPAMNNKTTAIVNKSSREYNVYDGANCTTLIAKIFARTANDNIGSGNNDRITSFSRIP
jgi:hypothetical protein